MSPADPNKRTNDSIPSTPPANEGYKSLPAEMPVRKSAGEGAGLNADAGSDKGSSPDPDLGGHKIREMKTGNDPE